MDSTNDNVRQNNLYAKKGCLHFQQDIRKKQLDFGEEPKEQVEIFINLKDISDSNKQYDVSVSMKNKQEYIKLGDTEKGHGKTIVFDKTFLIDYYFEVSQMLKFEIKCPDSPVSNVEFPLGMLMGSRGQKLFFKFGDNGSQLLVYGTPIKESAETVNVHVKSKDLSKGCEPFFVIYKHVKNQPDPVKVYKSEVLECDEFNVLKINPNILNNCMPEEKIIFEFHDFKSQSVLGRFEVTEAALLGKEQLTTFNGNSFLVGFSRKLKVQFLDYLASGLQISCMMAIDFTKSNGLITEPTSLHYTGEQPNAYQQSIKSCGSIIAYYDYDQMFPCFGYGGKINGAVNHCFALNGNESNPGIHGIDGINHEYLKSINNVQLWGPTKFNEVINRTINLTESDDRMVYQVLMIHTDGCINDMPDTIDAIVKASALPISIIIIGIGEEDFTAMEELDADKQALEDGDGNKAVRDIVQFVPFSKFKNDVTQLAKEVLAEIPKQILDYYQMKNIQPTTKK